MDPRDKDQDWLGPKLFAMGPDFFKRYYRNSLMVFLILDGTLVYLLWTKVFDASSIFVVTSWQATLGLIFLGLYLGALSAVFIHNASHFQFRPRFLNLLVGELVGLQQLYGFRGWQFTHFIHHRYPDDPTWDPVFPGDKSFAYYALVAMPSNYKSVSGFYFRMWGTSEKILITWQKTGAYWALALLSRLVFVFLALGSSLFLVFYLPSLVAAILMFSLVNYYCHRPNADGKFEVLNLDKGFYGLLNKILFGVFWHKDHHLDPSFFDPSKLKLEHQ